MDANTYIAKFIKILDELDQQKNQIPGLIMSHPGFGKTSTVRMYCQMMDYNLVTLIPSQYSADDILGLQSVNNGKLVRLTPAWFNNMVDLMKNNKRTLLFIDELSACDPFICGPLFDLIFSHNLGEHKLPDNVFIVAAGNYSDDLNNMFKMSAPMINRFMILNIYNTDYNVSEFVQMYGEFDQLSKASQSSIKQFLKLQTISETNTAAQYDFQKFKNWVQNDGEIQFGNSTPSEDPQYGLLGFTSIRSLDYSLKFIDKYVNTYNDDLWIRIVGDTLGVSTVRDKHMREIIKRFASTFLAQSNKKTKTTISSMCKKILNSDNTICIQTNLVDLYHALEKTSYDQLTTQELSLLKEIQRIYPKSKTAGLISTIIKIQPTTSQQILLG